jgi:hypothetical protein
VFKVTAPKLEMFHHELTKGGTLMVHPSIIEARLGKLGFRTSRWFKAEINELQHVLMDDEEIISLACGRYFGSFALLVATDQRLLLIDKRVFFMTIEDTRYDMVSEIDYNAPAYSATVTIYTMNKTHKFTSVKYKRQLRELTTYVQRRVWEFRQQQPSANDLPTAQVQAATRSLPQFSLPFKSAASEPRPMAVQPTDYYVDDQPADDGHRLRGQVGHVAHLVGSAATRAAHHAPIHPRPFHPYTQGSLMTRGPISNPDY